ncbi:MAG: T9SS type A sorting domain-containing protein, partial [Bacteroidia bacterium]|nr:T9SS type A sorting domain-containing protein [Bacteroidia bacterium]
NSSYSTERSGTNFYNTAVTVQFNKKGTSNSNVSIYGNEINDCRIGVHGRNVNGISVGANLSIPNAGNMFNFKQPSFDNFHHAIWLEKCIGAKVQKNQITKTSSVAPSPGFSVEGITLNECADGYINHNTITGMNTPMHIINTCTGTELHCNTFDNTSLAGDGVKLSAAVLPDQGVDLPGTANEETWDNKWFGYTSNNYGVTCQPAQQFTWYYDPSLTEYFPNPQSFLVQADDLPGANSDLCQIQLNDGGEDRDNRYGAIVGDSADYIDYTSELSYKDRENLFLAMKINSSLLVANTPNDAAFQQFYSDVTESNIGMFESIDSLMAAGNLIDAAIINSLLNDTNFIEYNRKSVNEILMQKILQDSALSNADTLILENIAYQNPITGGSAVFQARAILFLEIHDIPLALRIRNPVNKEPKHQSQFIVQPNPANENCTIKFPESDTNLAFEIRDVTGRLVFHKKIKPTVNSLNLNLQFLQQGVYCVRINDGNRNSEQKPLIIIR